MPELTGNPASYPLSSFENEIEGSCLCGSITITITQKGLLNQPNGGICHCSNCRKGSGTVASHVLVVPKENVELIDPKNSLKVYLDSNTLSGGTVPRGFCSNCGSPIGYVPDRNDPKGKRAFVCVGLFPRVPPPANELFTAHRQVWEKPVEGAAQFDYEPK